MVIQIYLNDEPLESCTLLIAQETARVTIPVTDLPKLKEHDIRIVTVKPMENMAVKAAVAIAKAIREAETISSPISVICPDRIILDAVCSVEYEGPAGGTVLCVPKDTGGTAANASRTRSQRRSKAKQIEPKPFEPVPKPEPDPGPVPSAQAGGGPSQDPPTPEPEPEPEDDPALVRGNEVNLDGALAPDPEPAPDPGANASRIIDIIKSCGVPSGQIPGVLDAIREAADAQLTLPMQIKLKLSRDQALSGKDPDDLAKMLEPRFDELKSMIKAIDEANAARTDGQNIT